MAPDSGMRAKQGDSLLDARSRPVQMGLIEGDDRSVGPLAQSLLIGDNGALIASIAPLYLGGSVLDVTYGRGVWWRRYSPATFGKHDLALDGVDFRALPEDDRSWDAVCFDPPYIPSRAPETTTKVRGQFRGSYGLDVPRSAIELDRLIFDGLAECSRVARQWVLVKTCDHAETRDLFILGHVKVILEGQRLGLRVHDLIVHGGGTGPGGGRIAIARRSRRAHSYLVVFAVPRRRARKAVAA